MKFSALSKSSRLLLGSLLILLGYAPIFFSLLHVSSQVSEKKTEAIVEQETEFKQEPMSLQQCLEYFSNIFGEGFVRYQKSFDTLTGAHPQESVSSQNSIPNSESNQDIFLANMSNVLNFVSSVKKMEVVDKSPSSVHTVTSGEFAGAKVVRGIIESNFYTDATHLTVPARVVDKVIATLSPKINFRRSLKIGDSFEIMYSAKNELLYARIITKRKAAAVFGPIIEGKRVYFFEDGNEVKPVQNTRSGGVAFGSPLPGKLQVSSSFGMRFHPITKQYKMHTGVDLAAAQGTQVYSIADGVVTRASYYYGYGNCVDIRHSNGYSSRYAHLSKFNVRVGDRVSAGQPIGLSGQTGMANGPHLHLEVAKNGVRVNPMRVRRMYPEVRKASNVRVAPKNEFLKFKNNVKEAIQDVYSHEL